MRELRIHAGPRVEVVESEMPTAAPGQVVIQVAVAAANPKDWKMPMWFKDRVINEGEDIAGTVYAVGEGVVDFKVRFERDISRHPLFVLELMCRIEERRQSRCLA